MKKLTNNEFIERAINIHNNEYDYSLVNYNNSKSRIRIICETHGEFEQIANNHLNGMGCPVCGRKKNDLSKMLNQTEYIEKAINVHGNKYDYSQVNYVGALNYVKIICPIHGIFNQLAGSHLIGRGCGKCGNSVLSNTNEFKINANKIHGNKYDYSLVKYVNSHSKVKIICKTHGEFEQAPTHHLSGQGCRICNESKGENKIAEYLLINSINFVREKKFNECKGKRRVLSFDFYLPENNVLIEFDGRQHYEKVNFNGCSDECALKSYFELKRNDKIKNDFVKSNNYNLLRINYNEINEIKNILDTYEPISQR